MRITSSSRRSQRNGPHRTCQYMCTHIRATRQGTGHRDSLRDVVAVEYLPPRFPHATGKPTHAVGIFYPSYSNEPKIYIDIQVQFVLSFQVFANKPFEFFPTPPSKSPRVEPLNPSRSASAHQIPATLVYSIVSALLAYSSPASPLFTGICTNHTRGVYPESLSLGADHDRQKSQVP
jgi:hypothetical protein